MSGFLRVTRWFVLTSVLSGIAALWALDPARLATQYKYDDFGQTEGLPYPSIRALSQNSEGYLWIGTRRGIGRFDGVRMTQYNQESVPELGSSVIQCFYAADDGTLWVGTNKGVAWYRHGVWSRPAQLGLLADKNIRMLSGDGRGGVLIGLKDQIFRYSGETCEPLALGSGVSLRNVNSILLRRSGDVVICGQPTVVLRGGQVQVLTTADGLSNDEAITAAEDKRGGLWIGTVRGLHYWKDDAMKSFSVKDGLPVNTIRSLIVDRDDNVWVGTPNGLTRYTDGHFEQVMVNGIERLSHILCLFEDREGNVWGGTDSGFFRLSDAPFLNISQREGLQSNSVVALVQGKDGSAWVGTWGGGVSHFVGDTLRTYRTADGLLEDGVLSLAEDSGGGVWVGYYARGVARFDGTRFTNFGAAEGVSERVHQISVTPSGEVWILQDNVGLCRLAGGKFEEISGSPQNGERAFAVLPDGSVATAGSRGIARYAKGKWELFPRPRASTEPPQSIAADARGALWIIRDGGEIDRFYRDKVESIKLPGTVGPLGYGSVVVRDELWASFRFGAFRVKLSELDDVIAGKKKVPEFAIFGEADGMRSRAPNICGTPGVTLMADGAIWFATSRGVAVVHPDRIRKSAESPPVVIESIRADQHELPFGQLEIPPGRGQLEFRFTALTLNDPARVEIKYRLMGFESKWVTSGRNREAHYGGLSPGVYRFEVTARNGEGKWAAVPATATVTILPFFYQSWGFWLIVFLALSVLFVLGFRLRVRRIQKGAVALQRQNAELEKGIEQRTTELAKSNEALRASEYFYTSLVESMPQIILRKDIDGRITYANSSFGEMMRRPLNEIIGRIDYDLCGPDVAAKLRIDDQRVMTTGHVMEQEHVIDRPGEPRLYLHCKRVPLYNKEGKPMGVQVLFWDMTRFRETEDKLKVAQRELVETSRLAGIAEMATGVLHNIGNALNSVNTSSSVVAETIRKMKLAGVARLADLLREEKANLADFFRSDPRGKQLPEYVAKLAEHLEAERQMALRELVQMERSVAHIKEIVVAQQSHARVSAVLETISAPELLEYALGISEVSLRQRKVMVTREFLPTPPLKVAKQKVLQVLVNIIRNAAESLEESGRADRRLSLGLSITLEGKIQIRISDNGVGISQENLTRIFEFGFTTKKTGHGFGLHSSALAAREMEGSLVATSAGLGKGATFLLELPTEKHNSSQAKNSVKSSQPSAGVALRQAEGGSKDVSVGRLVGE